MKPSVCWSVSTHSGGGGGGVLCRICTKANGLGLMSLDTRNQQVTYVTDKIDIGNMAWM